MTKDYTPTTEQVRKNWAYSKAGDLIHRTQDHLDEFDRWLAEVKAEAWDEGAQAARNEDFLAEDFVETPNPYREEDA